MQRKGQHGLVGMLCVGALAAAGGAQTIRTPLPGPAPRVNGPTVFGVRPNTSFVYKIPATGSGALTYSVLGLPSGLSVDSSTGMITGSLATAGTYPVTLQATNSLGTSSKTFNIKVGSTIGLTPAMGWSSWNAWNRNVTAAKVQQAADAMVSFDLIDHGWTYVNTDDAWQGTRGGAFNGIQANSTFLAGGYTMQGMVDHIHGLGLKAGIYSTPWIQSYEGFIGGSANNSQGMFHSVDDDSQKHLGTFSFATNDANQWAAWGFDYMKYDWNPGDPFSVPDAQFHAADAAMQTALQNSGRNIVYSYSNNMPLDQIADQSPLLNSWRTGQDIEETWASVKLIGFGQDQWSPYSSPGHFNDPDMLEIGWVGNGSTPHPTALTPDEQYTHVTLWSLLSAPLVLGNDLTKLDAFTLNLITNDEVIAVDQDALGLTATRKSSSTVTGGNLYVYSKPLEDGTTAVGLFNTGSAAHAVTATWATLGVSGWKMVRDLWRQVDLGPYNSSFAMNVALHGAELVKLTDLGSGATVTWKGAADGTTWNTSATNFNNGSSNVAFATGEAAVFDGTANSGATTITLAANVSPIVVEVSSSTYDYTFQGAGAISGGAVLAKDGISTLTILNANTYTGGTFVRGGTLFVGGAAGSLGSGPIVLGASLTFNRTSAIAVAGNISGNGKLRQSGAGTLILTGTNSFTGGTSIDAGTTLQIGAGGTTGTAGMAGIFNAGTLAFNRSDALAVANDISGPGQISQAGGGATTLSGALTYTGATNVSAGRLSLAGDLLTSNSVNVTGGTLELAIGGGSERMLKTASVSVTGAGAIDLEDNKMIVTGANTYGGLSALVASKKIASSAAAVLNGVALTEVGIVLNSDLGSAKKNVFGGKAVAPSDVLLMLTYAGDANLDGKINGDDYFRIDSMFASHASGFVNGDFNYDGQIDADDYFMIDRNYSRQGAAVSAGQAGDRAGINAVPEPFSGGILAIGAIFAVRRRRVA